MTAPRLRLHSVAKSFGATAALRAVSLEVGAGEVHALIGENGAGKSTLMKILSGAEQPNAGVLELDGQRYAPAGPLEAKRRGVAMIYQELTLAPHLSVQENILLGAESARFGWIDARESRERARSALTQLGHEHLDLERRAETFSLAEQQVIEIARVLLAKPRVLILDEPTSSLGPADVARLFAVINRLRDQGVSVIYISHFLEECRQVASRFTVLKDGQTAGTGAMADADVNTLVSLMTGREVKDLYPHRSHSLGAVVLQAEGLERAPRLRDASLTLRRGEIFGLAGLIGAGRTELVRGLFGLDALERGTVALSGVPRRRASAAASWNAGVGFLSENRKDEGLLLPLSLAENLTFTKLEKLGRFGWISRRRQNAASRRWIEKLAVRCREETQPIRELSGGNQQKIAIARLLEHPAEILLLDEPTRGIDVASKAEIYRLIGDLAAAGKAIILVSSYLPELLGLCDTIGVMCRGKLSAVRPRAEWTEAEIMRIATEASPAVHDRREPDRRS